MVKLAWRSMILLSLTFNVAFAVSLLWRHTQSAPPVMADVTLSNVQALEIKAVRARMQAEQAEWQQRLQQHQANLLALLKSDKVDHDAIKQCLETISGIQKEIQGLTVAEILQCKRILSGEQCRCLINKIGERMGCSTVCNEAQCPMATNHVTK